MADKGKEKRTIWRNARKCYGCERKYLMASSSDDQYVRAELDLHWDKTEHEMAPGEKIESVL